MITLENGCPQLENASPGASYVVSINEVNRLLRDWFESLDVVYGWNGEYDWHRSNELLNRPGEYTHTARLTKPVPIVRDSAEDVLEKIVKAWDQVINTTDIVVLVPPLIERARKLLDRGEK